MLNFHIPEYFNHFILGQKQNNCVNHIQIMAHVRLRFQF